MANKRKGLSVCKKATILLQRYWLLIAWLCWNVIIFYYTFRIYSDRPEYFYLRNMLGIGLCISRGTAPLINMSSCLVLLPMCRCINTAFHNALSRISTDALLTWLVKAKVFHITFAATILVVSAIHSAAHLINAINFSRNFNDLFVEINWASYKDQSPLTLLLTTLPGCTGVAMLFVLFLLAFTSLRWFRQKNYNVFWNTHHLAKAFLILVLIHPLRGVLKEQTNLEQHVPGCVLNRTEEQQFSDVQLCDAYPTFSSIKTKTWIWLILPLFIYTIETAYRICTRNSRKIQICNAYRIPGKVIYLKLKYYKTNINTGPGHYVLLQTPQISKLEWHPFTIVECYKLDDCILLTLLIKVRGDWTGNLYRLFEKPIIVGPKMTFLSNLNYNKRDKIAFQIDGPYVGSMKSVITSELAVCVAAGIGITAFAATLKYLLDNRTNMPKRIHLVWMVRSPQHFLWFAQLICDLHHKYWFLNQPDRFQFGLFLTKEFDPEYLKNIFGDKYPVLIPRIQFGRPNWNQEFYFWQQIYTKETITVFSCGPKKLTRDIRQLCYTENMKNKNKFNFIHEAFS